MHLDFSLFTLRSSLKYAPSQLVGDNFFNYFNSRLESTYPLEQRLIQTYSPKGYTSVTVGDTPTACARQTMSTRSGAILEQITDIIANKEVT